MSADYCLPKKKEGEGGEQQEGRQNSLRHTYRGVTALNQLREERGNEVVQKATAVVLRPLEDRRVLKVQTFWTEGGPL